MRRSALLAALLPLMGAVAAPLAAQAASQTFLLGSAQVGPSAESGSLTYALAAGTGSGVVAAGTASQNYRLLGGFPASLEDAWTGRPWLTGVLPRYAPLKGGTALELWGTELALGMGTAVEVDGKPCTVTARSVNKVDATLPPMTSPGYKAVRVTAGGETSTLPQGLGVLPLLELERPAEPLYPFVVRYRGNQGDIVVWLLAAGTFPVPIPLAPFRHGLELELSTLLVLTTSVVADPSGVRDLPLPPLAWRRPIVFQVLSVTTSAGWAPGSFTNSARL